MLYFESCFQHLAGKKTQLSCERDRPPQVVDGKAAIDIGDVHGEVAISGARVAINPLERPEQAFNWRPAAGNKFVAAFLSAR